MKRNYLYFLSLLIISLCCFSCEKAESKDEEDVTEKENYPAEIPFAEYLFGETMCCWMMEKFNYNDEIIVINSQEELGNYIECFQIGRLPDIPFVQDTCPEIDFSKHTLLLASGNAGYAIDSITKNIQQLSAEEYQLEVKVELNDTPIYERWITALVTEKIGKDSDVELLVTLCDEEANYPLENPFTEYSVWRSTGTVRIDNITDSVWNYTTEELVFELRMLAENKMQQKTTPPQPPYSQPRYRWATNSLDDYILKDSTLLTGRKIYDYYPRGWDIVYQSENEVALRYNVPDPFMQYVSGIFLTRQTDLK